MKEVFDVLYQQAEKLLETIDFQNMKTYYLFQKVIGSSYIICICTEA